VSSLKGRGRVIPEGAGPCQARREGLGLMLAFFVGAETRRDAGGSRRSARSTARTNDLDDAGGTARGLVEPKKGLGRLLGVSSSGLVSFTVQRWAPVADPTGGCRSSLRRDEAACSCSHYSQAGSIKRATSPTSGGHDTGRARVWAASESGHVVSSPWIRRGRQRM
jgi:hypothetical protein